MSVFSVVLSSSTLFHFYEAVSFAAGARAQGKTVFLFLRGPALARFVDGDWERPGDPAVEKGLAGQRGPAPEAVLAEIRAGGKVRIYACSAWALMLGLDNGALASRVDAVAGLNAFLSQAAGGPILYI